MKNKKIIISFTSLALLGLWLYWVFASWFSLNSVWANPDYICTKSVTWQPCIISSCEDWQTNGTRICNGKRTTEVSYYHTRTSCESGYSVTQNWNTSLSATAARYADQSALDSTWSSWSSGRHSTDYVSWSESCSVTEVDTVAPTWIIWDQQ